MNGAFAPDIIEYERKEKVGYMSGAVKKRLLSLLLAVSMIVGNTGQVLAQESAVVSEETAGNLLSAEPKGLSLEEEDREVIPESEEGISEQEEVKVNSGTESLPEQMQEGNSENYIEEDDGTEEASEYDCSGFFPPPRTRRSACEADPRANGRSIRFGFS